MKKADCERAIRTLVHQWASTVHPGKDKGQLYDSEFIRWLEVNHPELLSFRSTTSVRDRVEDWFAQETKQTWRN